MITTKLSIEDPVTRKTWEIPDRPIHAIHADVRTRWLINAALSLDEARALLPVPFLEPAAHHGMAALSLCVIGMDRAAPEWAPLSLGPAVTGCAVRLACLHRRTLEPAVYVATRCTDHLLGRLLPRLGFPDVITGLHVHPDGPPRVTGPGIDVVLAPGAARPSRLFATTGEFDTMIADGVRSYGRGPRPGTWSVIDLVKDRPSQFRRIDDRCGNLVLDRRTLPIDSIFTCAGGRWHWDIHALVDDQGHPVAEAHPAARSAA